MSAVDFRRLIELGPYGSIGIEVDTPTAQRPIRVDVSSLHLELDYSEAGELFDTLAQAMGIVVAGHGNATAAAAVTGLDCATHADTPDRT